MRLRSSLHSPYVRKVRVVAHELGISHRIELVPTVLHTEDLAFWEANPLAKIPVLTLDDGTCYFDSSVICEYLDATYGSHRLLPANGPSRWSALTLLSLADGVTDAGMLARLEGLRPAELRSRDQIAAQMAKVERGLSRLQHEVAARAERFDLPAIATACAIGWLVFRFGEETVLGGRDALRGWYDAVAKRPSMQATVPVVPA